MFGRKIRIPLDLLRPALQSSQERNTHMEKQFNQQHGAIQREFFPNDPVYIMDYTTQKRAWIPAKVIERKGTVIYAVECNHRIHRRHVNQIRPRFEAEIPNSLPFDILTDTFEIQDQISEIPTENNQHTTLEVSTSQHHPLRRNPFRKCNKKAFLVGT